MAKTAGPTAAMEEFPLLSNRFIFRIAAVIGLLALLSAAISFIGYRYGERMALAGHTDSNQVFAIGISQDTLHLSANTLRFASQRHDGAAERADLYFLWPEMTGYHKEYRRRFDDVTLAGGILFVQLTQSTMSRDMSGRLAPIYSHLFDGQPEPGPHGLTLHRLRADAGYESEVMLTAPRIGQSDYAVRCIMPKPGAAAGGGDCQRDIHIGRDLTVLYRFSSDLLADWDQIDNAIRTYFDARLDAKTANPVQLK